MSSAEVILIVNRIRAFSFQLQVRIIVHGQPCDINIKCHTAQYLGRWQLFSPTFNLIFMKINFILFWLFIAPVFQRESEEIKVLRKFHNAFENREYPRIAEMLDSNFQFIDQYRTVDK